MKLSDLTPKQRAKLAELVGTSPAVISHLVYGHRKASAETAGNIERAAKKMRLDIPRESVCYACNQCDLARVARKIKSKRTNPPKHEK